MEQHFWATVSHEFGQQTLGFLGCEKGAVEGLSAGTVQAPRAEHPWEGALGPHGTRAVHC